MDINERFICWLYPEMGDTEPSDILITPTYLAAWDSTGKCVYTGALFTNSFDACLEYLVPKAFEVFGGGYYEFMRDWLDDFMSYDASDEDMVKRATESFCEILSAWINKTPYFREVE